LATERRKKVKRTRGNGRLIGLLMLGGLFCLNVIVALVSMTQKRYAVSIGSVAPETIHAPRAVEDVAQTERLRRSAQDAVAPVFKLDSALVESLIGSTQSYFDAVETFRAEAQELRTATVPAAPDGTLLIDDRSWQVVMPQDELLLRLARLPIPITDQALGYTLLSASDDELLRLEEILVSKLSVQLPAGISAETLDRVRSEASRELQITTVPTRLKELGEKLYDAYLKPSLVEDSAATAKAREDAAALVEPVMIARGSVVVREGETITSDRYAVLTSLGLVRGVNENGWFPVGIVGYLLIAYVAFGWYAFARMPELIENSRQMTMLALILGITVLLEWVCYFIEPRISPAILGVLLTAVLLSQKAAMTVNLLLSVGVALLAGGSGDGVLGSASLICLGASLLGGQAAILLSSDHDRRGSLIIAGAGAGIVGALFTACGCAVLRTSLHEALIHTCLVLLPPIILSVFCVGMLSVWENLFDVVTPSRLHELLNGNHPLLRKMMTVAPGTFHHSMMAASLAEAAAEAIGANAMLARAGAMYHDVGKLRRPSYFSENQKNGNIHDTLSPEESASFIISHQRDAEVLLQKHRMPQAVRAIASEHHGNTLVAYFYFKAKKAAGDVPVQEATFRYPGPRPSTRESAIVMMADSCEAAVRSLGEATSEQVADMVHKVIRGKMDDNQFDDCPITLKEIATVEKSFLMTFSGILHDRVRYPGDEEDAK